MAANVSRIRVISYNPARAFKFGIGATAMRKGSLCKFSSGLLEPLADNDENLVVWVMLQEVSASATEGLAVPLTDCVVALKYTGTVPAAPTALGVQYGVTGPITVDFDNVTQILVTALKVDTTNELVWVTGQNLSI